MGKTFKEIKKAIPDLRSKKVEDISDELDRILRIKKLFQSDGGRELITVLRNSCSTSLRKATIAAKNGDDKLLMALILDFSAHLELLSTVQDISIEEELREQLDEAVKEAAGT